MSVVGRPMYKCAECGSRFATLTPLESHMLQHIGQSKPRHFLTILAWQPRAGSRVARIDPLRFLAGCRTRRLNQAQFWLTTSAIHHLPPVAQQGSEGPWFNSNLGALSFPPVHFPLPPLPLPFPSSYHILACFIVLLFIRAPSYVFMY